MEAGGEFQFPEVIGTNVLANEVVRHFSNLTFGLFLIICQGGGGCSTPPRESNPSDSNSNPGHLARL